MEAAKKHFAKGEKTTCLKQPDTLFFVLSFVTFTAWGMITHDLRGTVWYWAAGVLLAGLSEVWFRQVKKISEEKAQPLGFFRFGPMMICLIVRYLFWLLHHK